MTLRLLRALQSILSRGAPDTIQGDPDVIEKSLKREPHARTFRKAREQVKSMMTFGFSTHEIATYLRQWSRWWVRSVPGWEMRKLLEEFEQRCLDEYLKVFM